jgi:hypothetical protein
VRAGRAPGAVWSEIGGLAVAGVYLAGRRVQFGPVTVELVRRRVGVARALASSAVSGITVKPGAALWCTPRGGKAAPGAFAFGGELLGAELANGELSAGDLVADLREPSFAGLF